MFFLDFLFFVQIYSSLHSDSLEKKVMENNNKPKVNEDPNVKLIRELRAENERLRNSNENNTNLLLLTDSYKVCIPKYN